MNYKNTDKHPNEFAGVGRKFSSYWTEFRRCVDDASWPKVLLGCFILLISGAVLHLTSIAKLIVTIVLFSKLFLRYPGNKKIPEQGSLYFNKCDGEEK